MKIFVVGSTNMDLVVHAPFMPGNGVTITGNGFMTNAGGKGANQAVACAKLGGTTYMVGCLGEVFGDDLMSALKTYGVHTDYVERVSNISSGIAVIVVVEGDNRIILDRGANGCVSRELIDRALQNAEKGDYLIVQLEIDLTIVEYALRYAKERGMITVLNPAPATALSAEIFMHCDYFIPNQSETEFYTKIYPRDEKSAKQCAEKILSFGVKNVIITMGSNGSAGVCSGTYCKMDAAKAVAIDTTAAGDTYVGALITKLSEGADIKSAMHFASKASAITITRKGAQQAIPTREEVDTL